MCLASDIEYIANIFKTLNLIPINPLTRTLHISITFRITFRSYANI